MTIQYKYSSGLLPRTLFRVLFGTFSLLFFISCATTHKEAPTTPSLLPTPDEFVRAAIKGQKEIVAVALEQGMDPNVISPSGMTAAMSAAAGGHHEILDLLVAKGADLLINDKDGDNTMSYAIARHRPETVRYLIDHGVSPNIPINKDLSPLLVSVVRGEDEIAEILLEKGADTSFTHAGATPLLLAVERGDIEMITRLLRYNAPVNATDKKGITPLMAAAAQGSEASADLLLKAGADKTLRDKNGHTAADWAQGSGHLELARRLR